MGKQILLEIANRLTLNGGARDAMPWLPHDYLPNIQLRRILASLNAKVGPVVDFTTPFWAAGWVNSLPSHASLSATSVTGTYTLPSNLVATVDVSSVGGFRQTIGGWYQDDLGAAQAATIMTRQAGFEGSFRPLRAGSITGLLLQSSDARTAGTCTATVYKNGVATALACTLNGTDTTQKITLSAKDAISFAAGDQIDIYLASDADWAPTTADLRAAIEIEN